MRKLRLEVRFNFAHHRCGWSWVEDGIAAELGADDAPTLFVGAVECHLARTGKPIKKPWVGICHHAVEVPPGVERVYQAGPVSLRRYRDLLLASLTECRGIFTLSGHMETQLRELLGPSGPLVERLVHPTPLDVLPFSWDDYRRQTQPTIIQLGHFFRRFHAIYDLPTRRFDKMWLAGRQFDIDRILRLEGEVKHPTSLVSTPVRLPDDEYDFLLSRNLALVPLYDASACNSLLECIARATPVLTEALPAVIEYMGRDYPLYFQTLEDAARKAEDDQAVRAAHEYLRDMTKLSFSRDYFVQSLAASNLYTSLP